MNYLTNKINNYRKSITDEHIQHEVASLIGHIVSEIDKKTLLEMKILS